MKGIIAIEGMEFFAYHGCYDTERVVGNKFIVDLQIETDCNKAADSDNLNDALNYVSAYEIVAKEMSITSHLLEHVAKRILDSLLISFPEIIHISLKISKLNPPLGGKIAATSITLSK